MVMMTNMCLGGSTMNGRVDSSGKGSGEVLRCNTYLPEDWKAIDHCSFCTMLGHKGSPTVREMETSQPQYHPALQHLLTARLFTVAHCPRCRSIYGTQNLMYYKDAMLYHFAAKCTSDVLPL